MLALLLLGGNIGDLVATFSRARDLISRRCGSVLWTGVAHHSLAWGYQSDREYLNQLIVLEYDGSSLSLLDELEAIEVSLGRVDKGTSNWADLGRSYSDRTIDLDILYLRDDNGLLRVDDPRLVVPHPRIGEREFVLDLLREVDFAGFSGLVP